MQPGLGPAEGGSRPQRQEDGPRSWAFALQGCGRHPGSPCKTRGGFKKIYTSKGQREGLEGWVFYRKCSEDGRRGPRVREGPLQLVRLREAIWGGASVTSCLHSSSETFNFVIAPDFLVLTTHCSA